MKNRLLLAMLCLALCWTGCKKDNKEMDELEETADVPVDPDATVEDINVPDGFNFGVFTTVKIKMNYIDNSSNPAPSVLYTIMGLSVTGETEALHSGSSGDQTTAELTVNIPNHFKDIVIKTTWDGTTKYFEYPVSPTINAEMVVNGLGGNSGDTRSNNCYPAMNHTFNSDNTGFSINSDQIIQTIEILYTDGTSEIVPVNGTSYSY
ncbi:MAG: hypothetical protein AAGD05_04165 [Bacteroidota bacterium]